MEANSSGTLAALTSPSHNHQQHYHHPYLNIGPYGTLTRHQQQQLTDQNATPLYYFHQRSPVTAPVLDPDYQYPVNMSYASVVDVAASPAPSNYSTSNCSATLPDYGTSTYSSPSRRSSSQRCSTVGPIESMNVSFSTPMESLDTNLGVSPFIKLNNNNHSNQSDLNNHHHHSQDASKQSPKINKTHLVWSHTVYAWFATIFLVFFAQSPNSPRNSSSCATPVWWSAVLICQKCSRDLLAVGLWDVSIHNLYTRLRNDAGFGGFKLLEPHKTHSFLL